MTVKVLQYRGDGSYFLLDAARELDGLRVTSQRRILVGDQRLDVDDQVAALLERRTCGQPSRALDVIVAAPKPISVLLALESSTNAARVVEAHEQSVDAVVAYLTSPGVMSIPPAASTPVVGFTHGINRMMDPHLHSHVLVGTLDAFGVPLNVASIRRRAAAADALYLSMLRRAIPLAIGRAAWVGRSGATLIEGVDHGIVAAMSVPRDRRGRFERTGDKSHPNREEVHARWTSAVASAVSVGVSVPPTLQHDTIDEHLFARELGDGLVGAPDVLRAWAGACRLGDGADRIHAAVALVAPQLHEQRSRSASYFRGGGAVAALGPRPLDPMDLQQWLECRTELRTLTERGRRFTPRQRRQSPLEILSLAMATQPPSISLTTNSW